MDLQHKLVLERTIETIMDAGLAPSELEGTRTNVYLCISTSDAEKQFYWSKQETNKEHVYQMLGFVFVL